MPHVVMIAGVMNTSKTQQYQRVKVRGIIERLQRAFKSGDPASDSAEDYNLRARTAFVIATLEHGARHGRESILLPVGAKILTACEGHLGIPEQCVLDDAVAWREQRKSFEVSYTFELSAIYDVGAEDVPPNDDAG